jgi:hypothetical protein
MGFEPTRHTAVHEMGLQVALPFELQALILF